MKIFTHKKYEYMRVHSYAKKSHKMTTQNLGIKPKMTLINNSPYEVL